jgi:multiple sugar transport system permease protein
MRSSLQTKARPRRQAFGEWRHWGLVLISPWLIGFVLFKLIPILSSLVLSLTDFYLLEPAKTQFVGLHNYIVALKDTDTRVVLYRTIILALSIIPLQIATSIFFAGVLSHKSLRAKNILRTLFFLPSIIPGVAFTFMWQGFVDPTSGWLNRMILGPLGLDSLNHFYGRDAGNSLFILSSLWTIDPGMLIIMGAMQAIPPELYEAAHVVGAVIFKRFSAITLPLVTSAIFFTLILNLTAVFGGAIMLDRGFTFNSNISSYDDYIYFAVFRMFKLGAATSLAWIFFIFVMALVIMLFVTSKYWVYYPEREQRV